MKTVWRDGECVEVARLREDTRVLVVSRHEVWLSWLGKHLFSHQSGTDLVWPNWAEPLWPSSPAERDRQPYYDEAAPCGLWATWAPRAERVGWHTAVPGARWQAWHPMSLLAYPDVVRGRVVFGPLPQELWPLAKEVWMLDGVPFPGGPLYSPTVANVWHVDPHREVREQMRKKGRLVRYVWPQE